MLPHVAHRRRRVPVIECRAPPRLLPVVCTVGVAEHSRPVCARRARDVLESRGISRARRVLHGGVEARLALAADVRVCGDHLLPRAHHLGTHHELRLRAPHTPDDALPGRQRASPVSLHHARVVGVQVLAVAVDPKVARPRVRHRVHQIILVALAAK